MADWRQARFPILRACVLFRLSQSLNTRNKSGYPYLEQARPSLSVASNVSLRGIAILLRQWLHAPCWAKVAPVKRPALRLGVKFRHRFPFLFGHHVLGESLKLLT